MTQSTNLERTLRIALVMREATVLDENHWQGMAKRAGLKFEKGAWEVLNQNVSLSTFKDLLFLELIPGRNASAFEKALAAPVQIHQREIKMVLKAHQPDVARLCHLLISKQLMTTEALEHALDRAERDAHNVFDVLVDHQLITQEVLERAVADRAGEISRDNRILLAGDILIYNNLVTRDDWNRALESRAVTLSPLSVTLENLKVLPQADILEALERGMELPVMELLTYDLSPELLERFPQDLMRRQMFLPLSQQERHYEIATADPFNTALADILSLLTGRKVSVIYAAHNDLLAKFQRHFEQPREGAEAPDAHVVAPVVRRAAPRPAEGAEVVTQASPDAARRAPAAEPAAATARESEPFVDNISAVQLVSQIVESAISAQATDIHIEPQVDQVRVRFRVDGQLHSVLKTPAEMLPSIASRVKVLAAMNVTERRRPQDGHCAFSTRNSSYDLRVSTLPTNMGEKIVMRILDSSRVMTGLAELGLEGKQLESLERLIARPHGMTLVTGPTGCGKTSTLYACLCSINTENVNIITIEDPVEYQLEGITQVQVDTNIDLGFADGLRSSLRQDPDVIMVGEVRDADTAHVAVRAALTGHLVFSTLHANTAVGAISALVNMGIPPYLVAAALAGVVSQRLVRRICTECKKPFAPPKGVLAELGLGERTRKKFFMGDGCGHCLNTGYRGRTGLFEVVEVTEELRRAVVERQAEHTLREIAHKRSVALLDAGKEKIFEGVTTPSEVLKAVTIQ